MGYGFYARGIGPSCIADLSPGLRKFEDYGSGQISLEDLEI